MANGQAILKSGLVYEVKTFRYIICNNKTAEIEVLQFESSYGAQAKLINEEKVFTIKPYKTQVEALDAIIQEIESYIKNFQRVQECEEYARKEEENKI